MKRNRIQTVLLGAFFVLGIVLSVANIWWYKKLPVFFRTNAMLALNFFVVIAISFWLVQRNTDQRRRRDIIDDIINRCCSSCDEYSAAVDGLVNSEDDTKHRQNWRKMLTAKQKLDNYIALLAEYQLDSNYTEKLRSIQSDFRNATLHVEEGLSQRPSSDSPFDYTRYMQTIGLVESGFTALRIILFK